MPTEKMDILELFFKNQFKRSVSLRWTITLHEVVPFAVGKLVIKANSILCSEGSDSALYEQAWKFLGQIYSNYI